MTDSNRITSAVVWTCTTNEISASIGKMLNLKEGDEVKYGVLLDDGVAVTLIIRFEKSNPFLYLGNANVSIASLRQRQLTKVHNFLSLSTFRGAMKGGPRDALGRNIIGKREALDIIDCLRKLGLLMFVSYVNDAKDEIKELLVHEDRAFTAPCTHPACGHCRTIERRIAQNRRISSNHKRKRNE